jgi:Holliday junction resolvase RusA-like endonuclease
MMISIKPLSVNEAWQGKRFKTPKYKAYERDVLILLPQMTIPEGPLQISIEFGLSNKNADWDNPVKPFIDCLQKKYGFNDNRIKRGTVLVNNKIKKGEEYIKFDIQELEDA